MMLLGATSWICGAPGCFACAGSATAGSTSYSTATSSAASLASSGVSAMTTATGSPTWQTLPLASAGCGAIFIGVPSLEWIIQPQIRLPILSVAQSEPVSTATTPGILLAAAVSLVLILAGARGDRRNPAGVAPARTTSSVYWPCPVTN